MRIAPAKIERQENVTKKGIVEASTQDETLNLAADIFGRDFAMFAKDHMLMIKPEPEKNTMEKLKMLDSADIDNVRKAELLWDIVTILKEDMPNLFQEAYNHSDPVLREKWRDAIKKEVRDMINRGVFHRMKQRDVPNNRQCVKHKWVFDIKRL